MWLASIIATIIRRVSSGHNGTNVWVEAHFPPWPNELLCVLCESVACSRLSSSLPQSSQRTSPRTQSQTHVPSETEPLLEPLLTLAAAGQASLRSLTLKEHGRSSIVLHQTVYPHKK